MLNKFLYVVVTLASIVAAIAMVSLAGCEPDGPALKADPVPAQVPRTLVNDSIFCLDGWEVMMFNTGPVYRYQHDTVTEHLIPCKVE